MLALVEIVQRVRLLSLLAHGDPLAVLSKTNVLPLSTTITQRRLPS